MGSLINSCLASLTCVCSILQETMLIIDKVMLNLAFARLQARFPKYLPNIRQSVWSGDTNADQMLCFVSGLLNSTCCPTYPIGLHFPIGQDQSSPLSHASVSATLLLFLTWFRVIRLRKTHHDWLWVENLKWVMCLDMPLIEYARNTAWIEDVNMPLGSPGK